MATLAWTPSTDETLIDIALAAPTASDRQPAFVGEPPEIAMSQKLPAPNPDVIFRSLADGGVLFSTSEEVYFGLNEVGSRVWELLPPARQTLDELCAELQAEYPDVEPAVLRADVEELLGEMQGFGLVVAR